MNLEEAVKILCDTVHAQEQQSEEQVQRVNDAIRWIQAESQEGKTLLSDEDKATVAKVCHAMLHIAELNGNDEQMMVKMAATVTPEQLTIFMIATFSLAIKQMGYKPLASDLSDVPAIFREWKSKGELPQ